MENMHVFGEYRHLVGWYTRPKVSEYKETAMIMLTPGMLHHVGPMRLHVQLARELSSVGMASFRFDLSGIGESLAVASEGSSLDRAQREIEQACDWLQREHGFSQFLLFGLCSGADDGLIAACSDQRIVGVSFLDGCAFRTHRFYIHWLWEKYLPKILSRRKWIELMQQWKSNDPDRPNSIPIGEDIREHGDAATCQRQIQSLLSRGVRMQWIFTGGSIDSYSYAGQFFDMFPEVMRDPLLTVHFLAEMDHLATMRSDREVLLRHIVDWCAEFDWDQSSMRWSDSSSRARHLEAIL